MAPGRPRGTGRETRCIVTAFSQVKAGKSRVAGAKRENCFNFPIQFSGKFTSLASLTVARGSRWWGQGILPSNENGRKKKQRVPSRRATEFVSPDRNNLWAFCRHFHRGFHEKGRGMRGIRGHPWTGEVGCRGSLSGILVFSFPSPASWPPSGEEFTLLGSSRHL